MLNCQRHLFDLPDEVHYLNCAYMSPQLRQVEQLGHEMLARKTRPYMISAQDFFSPAEALKRSFAALVNIAEPGRVAVIPSVSYGIANVANNIRLLPGQKILIAGEQFPSNYYSWQRVAEQQGGAIEVITPPDTLRRGEEWNQKILNAIDDQTAVVALSHVHWADGTRFDLETIREVSRKHGALLVIDGSQSVGALPFDVSRIQPDALVVAGYKWLLGPYSLCLAYYGPYFDQGIPIEESWINRRDSDDFRQLVNYQEEYRPFAARYSVGEQGNWVFIPMLNAALQQLLAWQVSEIQAYCARLSAPYLETLIDLGVRVEPPAYRAAHLFGLRFSDRQFDFNRLKSAMEKRQVFVSFRGSSIRVSTHVFNRGNDLEQLVDAFRAARLSPGLITVDK